MTTNGHVAHVALCPVCGHGYSILTSGDTSGWGPPSMWAASYRRRLDRVRWLAEHHCPRRR